jgi:hypothetical protein
VPARLLVVFIALAATGLSAAPAVAAPDKPFEMVVAPASEWAGVTNGAYTVTLTNKTKTQQLGSADVTVPAAITIVDRNGLGGSGNVLELRNLALAPDGGTVTITLGLRMPCVAGAYDWAVEAKQSNDFSGPPGNSMGPVAGNRTTTVQGSCRLRFVGQPASAEKNDQIRADAFQPESSKLVSVEAIDARSEGATHTDSFNGSITLSSVPDALPPTSSTANAGLATFPSLSIPASGNYTLRATAAGVERGDSNGFQIIDVVEDCKPSSCSALSPQGAKSKATLTGTPTSSGGFALMSLNLGPDPLLSDGCAGYVAPGPDYFEFQLFGVGGAKTVVVEYTKQAMKQRSPSSLQVCFAVPTGGFTARDGLPAKPFDYDGPGGEAGGFAGLLPNCPAMPVEPCVLDRSPVAGGGAAITAYDPRSGDPRMH